MKKFLLMFLLPVCAVISGVIWAVVNPWLSSRVAGVLIERSFKDIRVQSVAVARQRLVSADRCLWEKVSCFAKINGWPITVKADLVEVSGLGTLWSSQRTFLVRVQGAQIRFAPAEAQGVSAQISIHARGKDPVTISGPVTIGKAAWDKIRGTDILFRLAGDGKVLEFQDLAAKAYGGVVSGSAQIVLRPLSYTARVKAEGIDTWRLAEINDQLSAQVAGRFSGTVGLSGDARHVLDLQADALMPSGGKINAALLSTLTQYLPQSPEKKRLDDLVKVGGKLAVEVFSFTIHSNTPDHLSGEVKLRSKEANLELNLTHDITTDGTWDGLAQSWQTIFH